MARDGDWTQVRLPSGEVRRVHVNCRATVGTLSNGEHSNITSARPAVRAGSAVARTTAAS
jgi:ribosomal protein L2